MDSTPSTGMTTVLRRWHERTAAPVFVAMFAGFFHQDRGATLILGALLTILGALLNYAFREHAGTLSRFWQQCRRRGDPHLYAFYAVAGPWCWRMGLGALAGLAVAVLVVSA